MVPQNVSLTMRLVPIIMALLSFLACQEKSARNIPEDKMIKILADLHISDQILLQYPMAMRDSIKIELWQSILEIHDISAAQLDTNLYLYQSDLEYYKEVSDKVVKHLQTEQERIK